jgi:hypothetical protein
VEVTNENKDFQSWLMWHGALLPKLKKMPELKEFLSSNKKQVKKIDEVAILARLKAYQKRVETECQS